MSSFVVIILHSRSQIRRFREFEAQWIFLCIFLVANYLYLIGAIAPLLTGHVGLIRESTHYICGKICANVRGKPQSIDFPTIDKSKSRYREEKLVANCH